MDKATKSLFNNALPAVKSNGRGRSCIMLLRPVCTLACQALWDGLYIAKLNYSCYETVLKVFLVGTEDLSFWEGVVQEA